MNKFLEQFYDIPVDENTFYLKRIFQDYSNRFLNLKSVRKVDNTFNLIKEKEENHFKTNSNFYLYTFKEEKFILTIGKRDTFDKATIEIEFLDSNNNYQNDRNKINYICGFFKKDNFRIAYYWPSHKRIEKHFVTLKYNNEERYFLHNILEYDPTKRDTLDVAKTEYTYDYVKTSMLNHNNQKHSLNQKPAEIYYTKNKSLILKKLWYLRDRLHRLNKPAELVYDFKNRLRKEAYFQNDNKHRNNEPAETYYKYEEGVLVNVWYTKDEFVKTETQKLTYLLNDLP